MKTTYHLLLFLMMAVGSTACLDTYTEEFMANTPVYMSYADLRASVKPTTPRGLANPGKIYFKDNYVFVVETRQGIHIIDLSNPASPQNIAFIEVPGCVDIAIKQNILYADSYVDLVAIDVSDFSKIKEVSRVENVLQYLVPPADNDYRLGEVDSKKGVVVDWKVERVRREMETNYYPIYPVWSYANSEKISFDSAGGIGGSSGSNVGVAGSMARFGLYGDYLYSVDNYLCYMFNVSNPSLPVDAGKQYVGWNVETLFIYDGHMFLGTTSGMQILNLAVPLQPTYVSNFWHATACDPVVVSNGYAYITLRGGTTCGSTVNRLDVVKLSTDYKNNTLVGSYPMQGPYGLGIDDEVLFVCDGSAGLKVYNVADKTTVSSHQIAVFPNIHVTDVIPINGYLFAIGSDGFYLYDYSDLQHITLKGVISVFRPD